MLLEETLMEVVIQADMIVADNRVVAQQAVAVGDVRACASKHAP